MARERKPGYITGQKSKDFGVEVSVERSPLPRVNLPPSGDVSSTPMDPDGRSLDFRNVIPPGQIGSKEGLDNDLLALRQHVDTVAAYETEQNDSNLHGAAAALRSAERPIMLQNYGTFTPRRAPMPRAAQDELYLEGYGRNAADPRMSDANAIPGPDPKSGADQCDLFGDNRDGVLHNENDSQETISRKIIGANPGPDFALRQSDAETMNRAMRGVTTSRAAGIAHQTAEREMKRGKR